MISIVVFNSFGYHYYSTLPLINNNCRTISTLDILWRVYSEAGEEAEVERNEAAWFQGKVSCGSSNLTSPNMASSLTGTVNDVTKGLPIVCFTSKMDHLTINLTSFVV